MKPIRKPPIYSQGQGYSETLTNPCLSERINPFDFLDTTLASDHVIWQETKRTMGTMPATITIDAER